jgi:hypothetical protein
MRAARWALYSLVCGAAFAAAPALAAPPFQDLGVPGGPLTRVVVGNELSCQVQHTGDTSLEFFPAAAAPGDCGTFIASGGTLYAPAFSTHDGTATGSLGATTPFAAVSQTAVTGSGGADSPRTVVTVADAGTLRITQTDSYVAGEESYRTDIAIKNNATAPASVIVYRAGDCYLQNTDAGYGFTDPPNNGVGCAENPNNTPPGRIEEFVPISPGNKFSEDGFSTIWGQIGAKAPFPDTCAHCGDSIDNGAGISWNVDVPPGATVVRSQYTTFSPTGRAGPPPSAPASTPPVQGPEGNPLGLPPARGCVDRRKWSFKLHHAPGHPVVEVDIFINNRFTRVVTGRDIKKLTLKKLPQGKFDVRLVATQDSGAQLISQRTYKGCKKSKPRTRRGHR